LAQKLNKAAVSNDLALSEQGAVPWGEEASLQQDIQRSLTHLQDLISSRLPSAASSPSHQAVIGRYREILLDLRSDFEKSRLAVRRATERKELLGSAPTANGSTDPAMDHLLRERNHINNSMNAASTVIGQADAIRSDLRFQGRSLRNAGSLLGQLTTNIPGLNHLVESIRRRRSRDDKVVAGVIASCILFTLWYVLS
jgi:Golgi SNAP receptor complex protein 1